MHAIDGRPGASTAEFTQGRSVFALDEFKCLEGANGEASTGCRFTGERERLQQMDGDVSQSGQDLRCGAGAHATGILMESHVPHPMKTVFHVPVLPRQFQQSGRIDSIRGQAGDAIGGFSGALSLDPPLPLQTEDLPHAGPVELLDQQRTGREGSPLQTAVPLTPGHRGSPGLRALSLDVGGKKARPSQN